jgi:hypothetical protein
MLPFGKKQKSRILKVVVQNLTAGFYGVKCSAVKSRTAQLV